MLPVQKYKMFLLPENVTENENDCDENENNVT